MILCFGTHCEDKFIAGVLAGMWPCGILVMLCELFTAESKTQVYAALHELLNNHPNISDSLSKYKSYREKAMP